jgi:aminopeptidase N
MLDASDAAPQVIRLADYAPPAFLVDTVDLDFDVGDEFTQVRSRLAMRRNPDPAAPRGGLRLDGDELTLVSIALDGKPLAASDYAIDAEALRVREVPDAFTLEVVTRLKPAANTKLMGLYASKDGLFTQCEAEGFRRITYFPDRPDVMARYTTTIHADRARYPQLLSNGNPVERADEPNGRHRARWVDPFPKPSYLFAMVAAKLECVEKKARTRSGREVTLQVYVEPGKLDQAGFALEALEKSMRWDEETFGLELDLDQYMIVAVGDFNMGAMENKGLNVFNTKYVLARPDTATDADYEGIDRVVAHEYFHNWTGNRVTCRDWFQLSLKEGLTVYRDQEFGADMYSRPVQRIQEVRRLRAAQFPEDAGPMAHPIRPDAYMEISNFYTATVYEKGAEVVRMIHTLVGAANFRKGMDLYFARHDGQAVRTEEFVQAMQDASGFDLAQFRTSWYEQAGTPVVDVRGVHDAAAGTYTLHVRQSCPPTPGQPDKRPFHIPLAVGLVGPDGRDLPIHVGDAHSSPDADVSTIVLSVTRPEETFVFRDVPVRPVPSLARGFSAPIVLNHDYTDADLAHLMAHDADAFNRWEAGQRLATRVLLDGIAHAARGAAFTPPASFVAAFRRVLEDADTDPAFTAEALALPAEGYLAEQMAVADPEAIFTARVGLRRALAEALRTELLDAYRRFATTGPYSPDARSAGRRALRNTALGYLMELADAEIRALALAQFDTADNMTDAMAALATLANAVVPERPVVLDRFHARWKDEALVVDKWLSVQSTSRVPTALADVKRLLGHPSFDIRNPNKVRALISGFCHGNLRHFHAADGSGYAFATDQVLVLDVLNPQVAARLARAFDRWKKFDAGRQAKARAALERIASVTQLSKDTREVVTRALA